MAVIRVIILHVFIRTSLVIFSMIKTGLKIKKTQMPLMMMKTKKKKLYIPQFGLLGWQTYEKWLCKSSPLTRLKATTTKYHLLWLRVCECVRSPAKLILLFGLCICPIRPICLEHTFPQYCLRLTCGILMIREDKNVSKGFFYLSKVKTHLIKGITVPWAAKRQTDGRR